MKERRKLRHFEKMIIPFLVFYCSLRAWTILAWGHISVKVGLIIQVAKSS